MALHLSANGFSGQRKMTKKNHKKSPLNAHLKFTFKKTRYKIHLDYYTEPMR